MSPPSLRLPPVVASGLAAPRSVGSTGGALVPPAPPSVAAAARPYPAGTPLPVRSLAPHTQSPTRTWPATPSHQATRSSRAGIESVVRRLRRRQGTPRGRGRRFRGRPFGPTIGGCGKWNRTRRVGRCGRREGRLTRLGSPREEGLQSCRGGRRGEPACGPTRPPRRQQRQPPSEGGAGRWWWASAIVPSTSFLVRTGEAGVRGGWTGIVRAGYAPLAHRGQGGTVWVGIVERGKENWNRPAVAGGTLPGCSGKGDRRLWEKTGVWGESLPSGGGDRLATGRHATATAGDSGPGVTVFSPPPTAPPCLSLLQTWPPTACRPPPTNQLLPSRRAASGLLSRGGGAGCAPHRADSNSATAQTAILPPPAAADTAKRGKGVPARRATVVLCVACCVLL